MSFRPLFSPEKGFLVAALLLARTLAFAASAPVVDSFVATPAVAVPGQVVRLSLGAYDPDCATSCTSGCGAYIRSDLLQWSDSTGRVPAPFANSAPSASGSPWSATVDWTAPPADGTYSVNAQISDSGTSMCGGRQTKVATLTITVSSVRAPVIDSFEVSPSSVHAAAVATLAAVAHDPDGRPLTYQFSADAGTITHASPTSSTAQWTAPANAGTVVVRCQVTVPGAPAVTAQRTVEVSIGSYSGALLQPDFTATRTESLPDGRVAMIDGATGQLRLLTREGAVAWSRSGLAEPVGVALFKGELWVLERRTRTISRWTLAGRKKGVIPAAAAIPSDLASSDSTGELALCDAAGSVRILDPATGAVKRTIGAGTLRTPTGIHYTGSQLAVADAGNVKLYVFDAQGALQNTLGDDTLFVRPQTVSRDDADGTWIVGDSFSGEIHVLDPFGTVRGTLGGFGQADGSLVNPVDVTFLPAAREIAASTIRQGVRFYSLVSTLPRPLAATGVTAADRPGDDGGAIQVSWAASPDDPARVTGYHVERDDGGTGIYTRLTLAPSGTTGYLDLTAGSGCHVYRVVATAGTVETPSAATACVSSTNDLPPPAPLTLMANALTPQSVRLRWSSVDAADLASYSLLLQWSGGSRTLSFARWNDSATLSDLTPDREYVITLRAVDSAGNQSDGRQAAVATFPDEAPAAATAVTASDLTTGGSVRVTWTAGESPVPVDRWTVELTPQQAGWPSETISSPTTELRVRGLVNEIGYIATVTPHTAWDRAGEPRSSATVVPSTPVREIPLLQRAGREGSLGLEDSAGVAVHVPFDQETRTVRFLYRTLGTPMAVRWNGRALGELLPDTLGSWMEAEVVLRHDQTAPARLELRNYAFPSPAAEAAVANLDLVPLPPAAVSTSSFDTVIDVRWEWQESRKDLVVELLRKEGPARTRSTAPSVPQTRSSWEVAACLVPAAGVCRDPFLEPGSQNAYRLVIASPAGWKSEARTVPGQTRPPRTVTPVTDLLVTSVAEGWRLEWTPISFQSRTGSLEGIPSYRIYRTDGIATTFLSEFATPPVVLPRGALRSDRERFVVRAVDDEGRESE